jgi:hydrogenase maturation protease
MSSRSGNAVVVIGVGNAWAGDDAAGVLVARMVRAHVPAGVTVVEHEGEPTALLDVWERARLAVVVDATFGGDAPGAVRVLDATHDPLPSGFTGTSTHAFSLAQAIELGRALARLPARLLVVGIEGQSFEAGAPPGTPVAAALDQAAAEVLARVGEGGPEAPHDA